MHAQDMTDVLDRTVPVEAPDVAPPAAAGPRVQTRLEHAAMYVFILVPFLALIVGIVYAARGGGISWLDIGLAVLFYAISGHGVTVGFHRYFTHGSFKAARPLRIALAVAGSLAVQGPVVRWVADHRKHHAFSDRPGDPHSPWKYGGGVRALAKGLGWAHLGWLFDPEQTDARRYAPDLLEDRGVMRVHRMFPQLTATSLLAPALLGWMLTGFTWHGAWTAFLWAGLVRIFVLHHVTWSVNSICHVVGKRPFESRDQSRNVWPLAVLSMGESWHNLHHADPTCARHGVDRGQVDSSAALIKTFEKLGWAHDVRCPDPARLAKRRASALA
jgi:stearoyl-CoA desaturase (Delta-9 desaturase)